MRAIPACELEQREGVFEERSFWEMIDMGKMTQVVIERRAASREVSDFGQIFDRVKGSLCEGWG